MSGPGTPRMRRSHAAIDQRTPSVSRLRVPSLAEPRIVGTRSVCSNVTISEAATSRAHAQLERAAMYSGARYMKWSTPRRLWWASHGLRCGAWCRRAPVSRRRRCARAGGACRSSSTSSAELHAQERRRRSASAMRCALPSTHGGRPRRFGCSVYHEVTCRRRCEREDRRCIRLYGFGCLVGARGGQLVRHTETAQKSVLLSVQPRAAEEAAAFVGERAVLPTVRRLAALNGRV